MQGDRFHVLHPWTGVTEPFAGHRLYYSRSLATEQGFRATASRIYPLGCNLVVYALPPGFYPE